MAANIARIGYGMILEYSSTGVAGAYTILVDLHEIKPVGLKVEKADATHHSSPNVAMEYLPGLIDYAELEATVSWSKTVHPAMAALLRTSLYLRVRYPDTSYDTFPGFIVEIQPATPIKERMSTTIKIQPTGLSTFTAAS